MKKTFVVAFLLMFGLVVQTQAVSTNSNQGNKAGQSDTQTGNAVQTQEQNQVMNQGEETQVQTQEQNEVKTKDKTKDKNKENKGQFNAELHRSAVATFVQSLLTVADRNGGIGQEVKIIAQQQNDTKDRASDLINAVENRNKVKTFFIGTSYKNLGELRSQMVQTRNQIGQLKQLAEKAENEGDKIELQSQIQVLEQEQTNIGNFITQNESKFSLFGWAVKLFRK
ncbi:hypothetical protein KJ761_02395 [Patescibacteria group bacterium]|nr:hypothetical protein [Patescibacteria group bacterium]